MFIRFFSYTHPTGKCKMPRSHYPNKCGTGDTPAFDDPNFNCPSGYTLNQQPTDPPDTVIIPLTSPPGGVTTIDYYWKELTTLPSSCGNKSKFSASTTVEETTGIEGSLDAKLGGAKLSFEAKNGSTLGHEIEFGETDYMCKATLYQLHAYIKSVVPGEKTNIGSLFGFGGSYFGTLIGYVVYELTGLGSGKHNVGSCEEQDVPLDHFDIKVCRKLCVEPKKKGHE